MPRYPSSKQRLMVDELGTTPRRRHPFTWSAKVSFWAEQVSKRTIIEAPREFSPRVIR